MRKAFAYCEYVFPQDVKDLYFGLPGTAITKIYLDQFIQETESVNAKILKDDMYDDTAIYKWNGLKFAFALQFLNENLMEEWLESRADFVAWVNDTQGIKMEYLESGSTPKDMDTENLTEHMKFWVAKKYFFEDLPKSRGMDPRNLITGVPNLVSGINVDT